MVYQAEKVDTRERVAIKKVYITEEDEGIPSTSLREIASLKELSHPNIIKLL